MHELVILVAKYAIAIPPVVALIVWLRLDKKHRFEMGVLLVLSAISTAALVKLATTLHQDPRPFIRDGVQPYFASSTDNGFPSDHATLSALLAFVMLRYSRKLGIGLIVLALLIGSARVIAGVHHTQDIIGGFAIAAIGVGLGMFCLRVLPATIFRSKQ